MTKTFTQNDLIRYLYRETTEEEERQINQALLCDSELRQQYASLAATKSELDGAALEPSKKTVNSILNYSKAGTPIRYE